MMDTHLSENSERKFIHDISNVLGIAMFLVEDLENFFTEAVKEQGALALEAAKAGPSATHLSETLSRMKKIIVDRKATLLAPPKG